MFGLMRARIYTQANELRLHRRLHYCGTCKTMEALYGRKSRVMLNNGTVFLAELLSALATDTETLKGWHGSYHSFNCLACPSGDEQIPLPLQFAATAAIILAESKVDDQIVDSQHLVWKTVKRVFSGSFDKAVTWLRSWDFPIDDLRLTLFSQEAREAQARVSRDSANAILDDLAEPTATATALFFRHGAHLIGKTAHEPTMAKLGYHFGAIVYLIDALSDYRKDRKRGEFNAIQAAYGLSNDGNALPMEIRHAVGKKIRVLQVKIEKALDQLPIADTFKLMFAARLHGNLSRKIGRLPDQKTANLPLSNAARGMRPHTCRVRMTLSERWQHALVFCKKLAHDQNPEESASVLSQCSAFVRKTFVFFSAMPIAFVAPHQALDTETYGGCMSIGLNMIFISTLVGSIALLAIHPVRLAARGLASWTGGQLLLFGAKHNPSGPLENMPLKHKDKESSFWGDCCSGDDCGGCDCCSGCDCGGCDC